MNLIKRIIRKVTNYLLIKCVYRLRYLIYESFHSDYIILTASVNPLIHNWGDDISKKLVELINPYTKVIIRKYSYNIRKKDDIACVGSIITWMTTPQTIIWGSGVVYPQKPISAKPQKVLAVRGPLTRNYLIEKGIDCPKIFGDPALLFPFYYKPIIKNKKYKIGIIPHFRDKNNPLLNKFRNDSAVTIIDVTDIHPWTKFIDEINQCENIISSSLHGIIISDAYKVPNRWIEFVGGEKKAFAFHDYLQSKVFRGY